MVRTLKNEKAAKPFLKWVGGKTRLLPQLEGFLPEEYKNFFEPFVGGGAFFFSLNHVGNAHINDINKDLVAVYEVIKLNLDELLVELNLLRSSYKALEGYRQKQYYYDCREEYNSTRKRIRKAALLIFLNKTGFNGLYRENANGKFNVPHGSYANPSIYNEENLRAVSKKLVHTTITSCSYKDAVVGAQKGDFIYFDPPYHPVNATSNFTAYHQDGFSAKNQENLRDLFIELDKRGCYVMLSNSNTDYIRDLYKDYRQETVYAARSINSQGSKRGKIQEIVVLNY